MQGTNRAEARAVDHNALCFVTSSTISPSRTHSSATSCFLVSSSIIFLSNSFTRSSLTPKSSPILAILGGGHESGLGAFDFLTATHCFLLKAFEGLLKIENGFVGQERT